MLIEQLYCRINEPETIFHYHFLLIPQHNYIYIYKEIHKIYIYILQIYEKIIRIYHIYKTL